MTDGATTASAADELSLPQFPWWLPLIQGIAALCVGLLLVAYPAKTTIVLVQFIGWYWLFAGVFSIISLFWDRTRWGWHLFDGIIGILAGGYIIGSPLLGAAVVVGTATLLLGIGGIIIGIIDIVKAAKGGGWGIGVLGAFSLIIGAAIAFNFTTYMLALPWVWGIFAIAGGIAGIIGSFQLKKAQGA